MKEPIYFTLRGRGQHPWPWVYADSAAERLLDTLNTDDDWTAPDLVSANIPPDDLERGRYACFVLDEPATLFLWYGRQGKLRRGLIVLNSDKAAFAKAQAAYTIEKEHL